MKHIRQWVRLAVPFVVLAVVIVGVMAVQAQGGDGTKLAALPAGSIYQPSASEISTANLYAQVTPSIVNISVITGREAGTGTGFVIDSVGHIVTNNHVVEGARYIEATFVDGTVLEAQLVGRDPDSDLAVIQVPTNIIPLTPITLADSDAAFVGQEVLAIGSPFGQDFTLTTGIVSALNRSLPSETQFSLPELIQTDAAINPGNSGGPLLNRAGQVIGVNTAILGGTRTSSGVGFAIPVNTVRRIVPYLIRDGQYAHTWLGITGNTLNQAQRDAMGLASHIQGVMVASVPTGGPAARAGLRGATNAIETPLQQYAVDGDIILAINGEPVTEMNDLVVYLEGETLPGDVVTIQVLRNGTPVDINVELQARPR